MHVLLLSMSAHITKQLGMAPGGEFRIAYQEVGRTGVFQGSVYNRCRFVIGSKSSGVQISFRRQTYSDNSSESFGFPEFLAETPSVLVHSDFS